MMDRRHTWTVLINLTCLEVTSSTCHLLGNVGALVSETYIACNQPDLGVRVLRKAEWRWRIFRYLNSSSHLLHMKKSLVSTGFKHVLAKPLLYYLLIQFTTVKNREILSLYGI